MEKVEQLVAARAAAPGGSRMQYRFLDGHSFDVPV
jgi:hypothetical protein